MRRTAATLAALLLPLAAITACGPAHKAASANSAANATAGRSADAPDETLGLNLTRLPDDASRVTSTSPMLSYNPISVPGWTCGPSTCDNTDLNLHADVYSWYNDSFLDKHKAERAAPKTKVGDATCVDTTDDGGQFFVSCWVPYDNVSVIQVSMFTKGEPGQFSKDSEPLTVDNAAPLMGPLKQAAHT